MNNEGSYICECDTGYIEGMGGSTDEYCTEGDCPGSCLDFDECDARTHKVKLIKSIFHSGIVQHFVKILFLVSRTVQL